ncbi:MAG: mechanosensitive ion channel domain-containing protein [bacterium]
MEMLSTLLDKLTGLIPTAAAVVICVLMIMAVRFLMNKGYAGSQGHKFRLQMILMVLSFCALLVVILTLPVSESTIGQLLSLLGILLSAAIALSATTFVGNIMAGLMLRAVKNFRGGDFVQVGEHFGRVSERGLFHIELQTEDRDLITLPNLYLVTNPVKVVRPSGTLVAAEVSLGYDADRELVGKQLCLAASDCGLEEPFVQVRDLGDYSVTYRVAGLLTEVRTLISARSKLREMMMDRLHQAGVEIVSPTFMNQRQLSVDQPVIPATNRRASPQEDGKDLPEDVVFDKADEAESLEKLRQRRDEFKVEMEKIKAALADVADDDQRRHLAEESDRVRARVESLERHIADRENAEK